MHGSNKTKLSREQKKAIGLLSIGTFLEYFDLMLYIHRQYCLMNYSFLKLILLPLHYYPLLLFVHLTF